MEVGMVFAIIFAVVLIGFIFVFALPQIGSFMSIGSQAQINKMIKDIETKVDDLYWNAGMGSSDIMQITMPSDSRLCFIDPGNLGNQYYAEQWKNWKQDEAVKVMIEREGYNVWYYKGDEQNGYKVNRLKVDKNFCTIGGTEVYLENEGSKVTVALKD